MLHSTLRAPRLKRRMPCFTLQTFCLKLQMLHSMRRALRLKRRMTCFTLQTSRLKRQMLHLKRRMPRLKRRMRHLKRAAWRCQGETGQASPPLQAFFLPVRRRTARFRCLKQGRFSNRPYAAAGEEIPRCARNDSSWSFYDAPVTIAWSERFQGCSRSRLESLSRLCTAPRNTNR